MSENLTLAPRSSTVGSTPSVHSLVSPPRTLACQLISLNSLLPSAVCFSGVNLYLNPINGHITSRIKTLIFTVIPKAWYDLAPTYISDLTVQ